MHIANLNLQLAERAGCTPEEKEQVCLPLLEEIHALAASAREEGLLTLEARLDSIGNYTLRQGLALVLEAVDPDQIAAAMEEHISLSGARGAALLAQVLAAKGALAIQQGLNPRLLLQQLALLLGEEMEAPVRAHFGFVFGAEEEQRNLLNSYLQSISEKQADAGVEILPHLLACLQAGPALQAVFFANPLDARELAAYLAPLSGADQAALLRALPRSAAGAAAQLLHAQDEVEAASFAKTQHGLVQAALRLAERGDIVASPAFFDEANAYMDAFYAEEM